MLQFRAHMKTSANPRCSAGVERLLVRVLSAGAQDSVVRHLVRHTLNLRSTQRERAVKPALNLFRRF